MKKIAILFLVPFYVIPISLMSMDKEATINNDLSGDSVTQIVTPSPSYNEYTLVVKRSHMFPHGVWHGFKQTDFNLYQSIINEKKEFHPRHLMEKDPVYKQIIPYLLFSHDNKFFLMQRRSDATATHLRNKLSLGIGGHVRPEDVVEESIFSWANREFHEEVNYAGNLTVTELGIVNDDSYEQGTMHMGFVFLLTGDSPDISIKSELKNGRLVSLEECIQQKENMEAWSKHVMELLEVIRNK